MASPTPPTHTGESLEPLLPFFHPDGSTDVIPRISKETLLAVLKGQYSNKFNQLKLIDCRFYYEYTGGHIDGAINFSDKVLLTDSLVDPLVGERVLLVLYCEYSLWRAPQMACHVRSSDRKRNYEAYPRLTYPDVYVLDGGYSNFFPGNEHRCSQPYYITMSNKEHWEECERELSRLSKRKRGWRSVNMSRSKRQLVFK